MKILYQISKYIYEKIELNLGIKTFIKNKSNRLRVFINHNILLSIHKKLSKHIFNEVIAHYGADYKWNDEKSQNLDKKSTNYGYGMFHYSLVRNQRPKRILCIGSMYGYIPYMLAKGCEENNFGTVDFVDAGFSIAQEDNSRTHYFGQGFWNKVDTKQHFSYLLDQKYLKTYIMTTEQFAKKHPKNTYDYIYLDGDHSYKGASLDIELFWPKLNNEGFICFHDIHLEKRFLKKEARETNLEFGYRKLWSELVKTKKFKFELSNHYSGLGFIQKIK